MRVLFITHYSELYGANRSLLELVLEVRDRGGVQPHVLLPREGELASLLRRQAIPTAVIPFEPWMSERQYSGRPHHCLLQHWRNTRLAMERAHANRKALPGLIAQVRAWNIQLLHANSAAVSVAHRIAGATGLPLVWHVRELPERHFGFHLDAGRHAYRRALRSAYRIIAISDAVRADIERYTGPSDRITIIPNGVLRGDRYPGLQEQAHHRWSSTKLFTFLMVGLIHPSKGQLEAVEALSILIQRGYDVRLVIAGGGRDRDLRERIARSGIADRVELLGFVEEVLPLYFRSHAMLMCSRNEAMGRVTVEAMACGLPVIGHASGGTPELVENDVTGLLYTGGASDLADQMIQLVADAALARRLGDAASLTAQERFSVERCAQEVLGVYRSVLSTVK
jgi:glycosyltransferase involved in cell wall biosynthesis